MVIEKVDKLVDICNAMDVSSHDKKQGCEVLNSPAHKYLDELIKNLNFFSKWKHENPDQPQKFILDNLF